MRILQVIRSFVSRFSPSEGVAAETGYRAYTKRFDCIISAENLIYEHRSVKIGGKSIQEIYEEFQALTHSWRVQAGIAALEASARVRTRIGEDRLKDTVVTLLVDHSGSMRGQKLLLTMEAVSIATDFLVNLGVKVEVLGFTTSSWQGGTSRWLWLLRGKAPRPGRLCDLLHIVYREADSSIPGMPRHLSAMLLPDLLKENVDGEAVQWAAERLRGRQESRKNIIVVSDGAPVDDSTLLENGEDYLSEHLDTVLSEEKVAGEIAIAGLGICYASQAPYELSTEINTLEDLKGSLIELLEQLLSGLDTKTDRPAGFYH